MPALADVSQPRTCPARRWFHQHAAELFSRARGFAKRLPRSERDDARAEIVASVFRYALGATARGKLDMLTPFSLVSFFGRSYVAGRRFAGSSVNDVLTYVPRPGRPQVLSLSMPVKVARRDGIEPLTLAEVLADRRCQSPFEHARQNIDYEEILDRQAAGPKVRRVFRFLAETHGEGVQKELAGELGVSQPRVVQLKYQLADCLAAEGYQPAGRTRPRHARTGRPRRQVLPLNVGTSPPPCTTSAMRIRALQPVG